MPDGMKVKLLQCRDQNGNTKTTDGKLLVSHHGAPGEVPTLAYAVAKALIAQGCAVAV